MNSSVLEDIFSTAKSQFDLTQSSDLQSLLALSTHLLEQQDLDLEQLQAAGRRQDAPLEFQLALKLVISRRWMLQNQKAAKIAVIFAMWGEHHRLLPKSANNPHGEDSLRTKLEQLQWICADTPVQWQLFAVDDGCPHGSADLAEQIASAHPLSAQVQVLRLQDALPASSGALKKLASADDSRKAGAIIHGCEIALQDDVDAVIYTDADNSVHLGQIGLLLQPFLDDGVKVVLGDRKHPDAVLVKQEARWGQGIVLLRHMQRMIGHAIYSRGIFDTQAAFKLFSADVLRGILQDPTVFDFSFDSDWILGALAQGVEPRQVPFAFIDSAAESASIAQGPMTTWEALLQGLVAAVRRHGVPHNEEMAAVLDQQVKSSTDLDRVINTLPPALANAPAERLGDPSLMSPADVGTWFQSH